MTNVADENTILIVIALLVGLIVGWWMFKRSRRTDEDTAEVSRHETQSAPVAPALRAVEQEHPLTQQIDGPEGNGLVDEGAAATTDVAGELLGVKVHSELPGAGGPPDSLAIMKGVGPKFVAKLNEQGITRFEQIARLSSNEQAMLDEKMGPFKGRLVRDRVVEQASYLARGDRDGFEAKFGKLGSVS